MFAKGTTISGSNGHRYRIEKDGKSGRQGVVPKVTDLVNGEVFGLKQYHSINGQELDNLRNLQKNEAFQKLKSVVKPLDVFRLNDGTWCYTMKWVAELERGRMKTLSKALGVRFPDAGAATGAGVRLMYFLNEIHHSGLSYKDISEKNVLLNIHTGAIFIVDIDNLGSIGVGNVRGTGEYMDPLVVSGQKKLPDYRSDLFAAAVYLYRLMVGGYPFAGKKAAEEYFSPGEEDYYLELPFVWNPLDRCNAITGPYDSYSDPSWGMQCIHWNNLPENIKKMFNQAFINGVADERNLPEADAWLDVLKDCKAKLKECPYCGSMNYGNVSTCFLCRQDIRYEAPAASKKKTAKAAGPAGRPVNSGSSYKTGTGRNYNIPDQKIRGGMAGYAGSAGKTVPGNTAGGTGKTAPGNAAGGTGKTAPGNTAESAGKTVPGNTAGSTGKTAPGNAAGGTGKTAPGNTVGNTGWTATEKNTGNEPCDIIIRVYIAGRHTEDRRIMYDEAVQLQKVASNLSSVSNTISFKAFTNSRSRKCVIFFNDSEYRFTLFRDRHLPKVVPPGDIAVMESGNKLALNEKGISVVLEILIM